MTLKALGEGTPVTVGVLMAMICGSVWLANVAFQSSANAKDIQTLQSQQAAISAMQTDIAVIKNKVESIETEVKKGDN